MILLIVIQVINIFANQIFYLYPTEGEFYQNYIRSFITNAQLMCQMYPQVSNLEVIYQCKEIYRTQGNEFISMSSNNTHFGTLSNDNEIVIYEWKYQMIQQLWQTVTIDPSFNWFNIDLSLDFSIILDCYYKNEFFLIKLIDAQSTIAFQMQSYAPISTKINQLQMEKMHFQYMLNILRIMQYFNYFHHNFQIQVAQLTNLLILIYQILQVPIFMQLLPKRFYSQFYLKYNFSLDNMIDFTIINVYYNFQSYSQCDQIQVLYIQLSNYQSDFMIGQLMGCEGNIIKISDSCPFKPCQPIQNILQNNQFIIYQSINEFCIYSKQEADKFYFFQNNQRNSLLYFDYDNYLFQFDEEIGVYQISVPSIQINLTKLTTLGNLYYFSLTCMNYDKTFKVQLIFIFKYQIIKIQIFNSITSNYGFNDYEFSVEDSGKLLFYGYSGQLLNYTLSKIEPYFNVTQITFYKVGETNQVYQFKQILSINYPIQDEKQYFIGYINNFILFLVYITIAINSTNQLNSIQLTFLQMQIPQKFPIAFILIAQDTIFLFQYLIDSNSIINYSNQTFKQKFSDFLVTYNSIIILMRKKQEILITTFNFTNSFSLNQNSINKFFKNIQFNPEQIIVNTQLMSSLLFINNINDVIILSINQIIFQNLYP
ncbi:unnamed protein product [Paramecium primaurelia]|uniref:Uncharacterized protein n=1 Tax=Paramecium primaurelia TaxID=5886 RepID=A0A8S1LJC0_PARPR|nr:unnamed protein product [Paramecium primaurelia]